MESGGNNIRNVMEVGISKMCCGYEKIVWLKHDRQTGVKVISESVKEGGKCKER